MELRNRLNELGYHVRMESDLSIRVFLRGEYQASISRLTKRDVWFVTMYYEKFMDTLKCLRDEGLVK